MPAKNFHRTIPFRQAQDQAGNTLHFPLVRVNLITPTNKRRFLSLLFDTGASFTTLRSNLYPFLGLNSWDEGLAVEVDGVGGRTTVYQYTATLELLGKTITCPIHLAPLQQHPLWHGFLGRDTVFNEFGFGFWESTKELFVTDNP